jgi:hypothetical protein
MSNLKSQISTLLGSSTPGNSGTDQLFSTGSYENLDQLISTTAGQLADLQVAIQAQASSMAAATTATRTSSTGASSSSDNGFLQAAGGILGGFTLSPIVRGLMSLFGGGGDDSAPAVLPKYVAPPSVSVSGGLTDGTSGLVGVDYGQNGQPRAMTNSGSQTQVTVNIQAMDSQSFLDRSDDIARAVKRAMLESSSLNDVVSEL